ncbi:Acetylornithine deacetylase/Succinyl-diaminopimelate desuccinylase [Terribacillus halophilus]|uniref:Acetylornithine deacetylase/Succinyl-diaminopimelate desuccinylase n=1 Tax=Terribacillus halophilus TaxID=361279 RepID=A0A1G6HVF4_9BACI|nr:M20/M25/M40 family metallo-hydrolase [Terribacillus halophilus]SDB98118.1 Acetylornithine deacetylase/Succinyl-diaminopimelate desuccinylase [Terribacillus halophilus]
MAATSGTFAKEFGQLVELQQVRNALYFLKQDNEQTTNDQIEVTEVEAPPFNEANRAAFFKEKMAAFGLENLKTDAEGNVYGIRKGRGSGPTVVIAAHLDTVFPAGTNVKAKIADGIVYAPGIGDDGRGLAVLLTLLRTLEENKIETEGDIIFLADVGEEGLGDLRGMKSFFHENAYVDGFISVEPGAPGDLIYCGVGSKRYNVTFKGKGGHSFGDFGTTSAIHAAGRAIAALADMSVPEDPKTTYNVGTIHGGTSINTIAQDAGFQLDLRSVSSKALAELEENALALIKEAAQTEGEARKQPGSISVTCELVGDRPAGSQPKDAPIRQIALQAAEVLGLEVEREEPLSTDANVPISLGIPALTLGGGGNSGGHHTLEEFFDPTDAFYGPQRILLSLLAMVGIKDNAAPLLPSREQK